MVSARSRLAAALVAAVVALSALGAAAGPATAAGAAGAAGLPGACAATACPDPTGWSAERWKPHAGYPSHGGTLDGMNCTNYVAWRLLQNGVAEGSIRGLGNAATWAARAATKGFTVNGTAAVGAIAQWNSNHVAYVEQINANGTMVISESNVWVGTQSSRTWLRHRTVSIASPDAFIHFRAVTAVAPLRVFSPGDFDRDGTNDLLVVRSDGLLKLYRGDGAGAFRVTGGTTIGRGWAGFRAVFSPGDFSGDRAPDVIGISAGKLYLYRGNGKGGWLGGRIQIGSGWGAMRFVFSSGDFSGDGKADVLAVLPDGRLRMYTGNGASRWKGTPRDILTGLQTATLVTSPGDVDGDGRPDVVAVGADGALRLFPGDGRGGFLDRTGIVLGTGWADATALAGRDLTGDGVGDLLAVRTGQGLSLHAGPGAGAIAPGTRLDVTW